MYSIVLRRFRIARTGDPGWVGGFFKKQRYSTSESAKLNRQMNLEFSEFVLNHFKRFKKEVS